MKLRIPRELKRPSFPVEDKFRQVRGDVNSVKPLYRSKREPIDFDRLPIG